MNLQAFVTGATPSYFAFGLPDGNVHGLALSLLTADGQEFMQGNRISLKDSMPLQSTLFSHDRRPGRRPFRRNAGAARQLATSVRLGLTILCEPSLHGSVAEPDLRGVDPRRHMIVVIERNRTGSLYRSAAVGRIARRQPRPARPAFDRRRRAQVLALECLTNLLTDRESSMCRLPRRRDSSPAGRRGPLLSRPIAAELAQLVDHCLPKKKVVRPRRGPPSWCRTPGLIYSGAIAAQTLAAREISADDHRHRPQAHAARRRMGRRPARDLVDSRRNARQRSGACPQALPGDSRPATGRRRSRAGARHRGRAAVHRPPRPAGEGRRHRHRRRRSGRAAANSPTAWPKSSSELDEPPLLGHLQRHEPLCQRRRNAAPRRNGPAPPWKRSTPRSFIEHRHHASTSACAACCPP